MTTNLIDSLRDMASYFQQLPEVAEKAALYAINDTLDRTGLAQIRKQMRAEIDFPANYLEDGRLFVARRARPGSLEGVIRGRDRATSLARFARGQNASNTKGRGVRVTIAKGRTVHMKKAFFVNLRNGNQGLAVRLAPGQQLHNSKKAVKLANNVYLLYGPSVDQVFRGVAVEQTPKIQNELSLQFLRQFERLTRG